MSVQWAQALACTLCDVVVKSSRSLSRLLMSSRIETLQKHSRKMQIGGKLCPLTTRQASNKSGKWLK